MKCLRCGQEAERLYTIKIIDGYASDDYHYEKWCEFCIDNEPVKREVE